MLRISNVVKTTRLSEMAATKQKKNKTKWRHTYFRQQSDITYV